MRLLTVRRQVVAEGFSTCALCSDGITPGQVISKCESLSWSHRRCVNAWNRRADAVLSPPRRWY